MHFAVGVLYSSHTFLELVQKAPLTSQEFPQIFRTFEVADPEAILQTCLACEWITVNPYGQLIVTQRGTELLRVSSIQGRLRFQLRDMITIGQPSWSSLLGRGRVEASTYFPRDVNQCFREAGLYEGDSEEVVAWWDVLAKAARAKQADAHLATGREGERLSLAYETRRTGVKPIWQALDSNSSGYDLRSRLSPDDRTQLLVEVKTSDSRPEVATLHISRNEWFVATTAKNYVFHLWALRPEPALFVVPVAIVGGHIPTDGGQGEWESVEIPFSALDLPRHAVPEAMQRSK